MTPRSLLLTALISSTLLATSALAADPAHTFKIGDTDFLLDGQRLQIRCGEIHAARVPMEYWRDRLRRAHAMGLNTVCAYLFWNMQEPREGQFNWTGQGDIAQFCKIAQEEGLWVILRPGPYACAEWEMGGLPWWLLKDDSIKLRTSDPKFLEPAKAYLKEVGRVLAPLQITHGGPIIMVQAENEYGSYGSDANYMGAIRQALLDAGFDVPLFACNPTGDLRKGYRADLFPVVNFGSDPATAFRSLRNLLPKGPLMCGEFYPGWFDTWGVQHHMGNADKMITDLDYMLKNDESFSMYMAHGGSTFGLWSGADRPFKPDTSSYDYDAPISEAGWTGDKFDKTRALFTKYLLPGEKLPDVPPRNPVITFAATTVHRYASVFENLPAPVSDPKPRNLEAYDLGYGNILYRTSLPVGPAGILDGGDVRDFGHVFLNGDRLGVMDRRSRNFKVQIPERRAPATLDIFVETAGRVNFGQEVHDRKGINVPVKFTPSGGTTTELPGPWQVFPLPLDKGPNGGTALHYPAAGQTPKPGQPGYYEFTINIERPADTFLDMRSWSKGIVWVNDHCLGRFWSIGPTQTMYVPGPWLKAGANTFTILDTVNPTQARLAGLMEPILNELHPELDFNNIKRPPVKLALDGVKPVLEAQFLPGAATQEVQLPAPAKGRYFCIESLSAQDGQPYAAIAELDLLADGKSLSHATWSIAYVDSEEKASEDGSAENAINGQNADFWHTQWSGTTKPNHPHRLIIDLGKTETITAFRYVPRPGAGTVGGRIKDYKIYVGDGLIQK